MSKNNLVSHPKHYANHKSGVECIDVVEGFEFNLANVIKYVWRHIDKGNPKQDLEKALWYLKREKANRALPRGVLERRGVDAFDQLLSSTPDTLLGLVAQAADTDDLDTIERLLKERIGAIP